MRGLVCVVALLLAGSLFAQVAVAPNPDHDAMLLSADPKLAANKRLAYDFWRVVIEARRMDMLDHYLRSDFIQHNPNADSGIAAFRAYFERLGGPLEIQPRVSRPLVSIVAEGDLVVVTFVREMTDPKSNTKYTTTWFDMLRIEDGRIAEHWDGASKP